MAEEDLRRAADLEWSEKVAQLAVDGLVRAKAIQPEQSNRAVEIIAKEVYDLLAEGDRPTA